MVQGLIAVLRARFPFKIPCKIRSFAWRILTLLHLFSGVFWCNFVVSRPVYPAEFTLHLLVVDFSFEMPNILHYTVCQNLVMTREPGINHSKASSAVFSQLSLSTFYQRLS